MIGTDPGSMIAVRHAVENASNEPLDDNGILEVLRTGSGSGPHVRAVFSDVSLQSLARAGRSHGIGLAVILAAYSRAREDAAAANRELDEAMRAEW